VVDKAADRDVVVGWWRGLVASVPPTVIGLWFGLVELAFADGSSARHLSVAGCPSFDPDDDSAEWATEYCWWPEGRYVLVPGLAALDDSDPAAVLEYAAELVRELPDDTVPGVLGVATGFDDGDFRLVSSRAG
jgi:hypothetical protein